jgi:tyrosinase
MLRIYAAGVKAMKALRAQDLRSWAFQWYVHATPKPAAQMLNDVYPGGAGATFGLATAIWSTCQAHQGQPEDYFLPWHRLYVLQFEHIIRAITGRDEFTLPYWDYTSPATYAIPEEFQATNRNDPLLSALFVGNRNKDGGRLNTADVNAGEPLNKHFTGVRNFLVLPNLKEPSYSAFCSQLDSHLHGAIHVFTGDETNMGVVPTAANDPVFWLHHCNIDRLWAAWNAAGGINPVSTNGEAWADTTFAFPGSGGQLVQTAISKIADAAALPYKYDKLPGVSSGVISVAAVPQMNVLLRSIAPGAELSQDATPAHLAPVVLGPKSAKVKLAPAVAQNRLRALAPNLLAAGQTRLFLLLKDVQAQANPDTVYQVFLDLADNSSSEMEDEHYVGLLNFFGVSPVPGQKAPNGHDVEFDVTDLVQRLYAKSALGEETSVTLVPVGPPTESSRPTIDGGVELLRR